MSAVKKIIGQIADGLGIEVHTKRALRAAYLREKQDQETKAWHVLKDFEFDHILDIGANIGQFAEIAHSVWPNAVIDSFEPLPDVFSQLTKRLDRIPNSFLHQVALGRTPGTVTMKSNEFSPSSSILELAELHSQEWPSATKVNLVKVPVETLDIWDEKHKRSKKSLLIKIDVQGYELEVIEGALNVLRRARWLVLEVSFYELYAGQPMFGEIHQRLAELGYIYRGNVEQFMNKAKNKVLFADAMFENISLGNSV